MFKHLLNTFLVAIGLLIACYTTACSSNLEKKVALTNIKKEVETINKKLPTMVSPGVQMDKIEMKGEEALAYYFILLDFNSDNNSFETESAKASIIKELKADQEAVKDLLASQLQIHYFYYDMNHKLISEIKITPKDIQ